MQERMQDNCKKRCPDQSKQPKKAAKHIRTDEDFKEISEKDLPMEQLMAQMKSAGIGGMSMYNKEDMEDMAENIG